MKKLTTLILIIAAFANAMCIQSYHDDYINGIIRPVKSGNYKTVLSKNRFSNGDPIVIGSGFNFNNWEKYDTYTSISCKVIDIDMCDEYEYRSSNRISKYEYTLECTVTDKIQFYYPKEITYKELKGYRNDGTLLWTRDRVGSTDISCYSKNGLYTVKRVNSPSYCK